MQQTVHYKVVLWFHQRFKLRNFKLGSFRRSSSKFQILFGFASGNRQRNLKSGFKLQVQHFHFNPNKKIFLLIIYTNTITFTNYK